MDDELTVGQETKDRQFPCEQCGAGMAFEPSATALECPYCGHVTRLPESEEDVEELDYTAWAERAAADAETEERRVVRCPACGAEATFDPSVTSDACPFCGESIVTTEASRRAIRPRSVLPFSVDRDRALAAWDEWIRGLWFAPNDLRRRTRTQERLQGVYVPYWTYDGHALTWYRGQRGDDYWTTETYTTTENGETVTKTRRVRRTRWTPVRGRVWNVFDDLLVLASRSLPARNTEKLEPWDLENLVPYDESYLGGFRAESYQVGIEEGFERARERAEPEIHETIRRDIGGDHQRIASTRSRWEDVTFKHLLLPVWISAYRWRDRVYRFVVNGRTGEVQGERPWSWVKIALAVAGVLAVAGAAVGIAMWAG